MKSSRIRKFRILGLCLAAFGAYAVLGCSSSASSESNEPDNFRGIKWGEEFSSVSSLNQIAGEGGLFLYEKSNDQLQMGEVRLEQIIYGFYKSRFYMGMIYFPSVGFKRIEEMMTRQLGQPAKPDNTPSKLIWDSDNVSVLLTLGDKSDQGRLVYIYKPIQLEVELKK